MTTTGNLQPLFSDGGFSTSANVVANNINASSLVVNGANVVGYTDANVEALLSSGNITGNIVTTANISGANIDATNILSGTYIYGDISNTTGGYSNTSVASYLGNSSTNGNIYGFDVHAANAVTANLFIGNFQGNITGNLVVPGANTQVLYNNAGNAGASIDFTFDPNVALMTVTGSANITGNIATGNLNAAYLHGDGSNITGLPAAYTDTDVENLLASGTVTTNINTTGNIIGGYLYGDGSNISGLPAGYSDSNVTALLSGGTVSTNIITTANISAAGITTTGSQGNITGAFAVSAQYLYGDGSNITGIISNSANTANYASGAVGVGSFGSDLGPGINYNVNDPAVLFSGDDMVIRTGGTANVGSQNNGQMDIAASEVLNIGLATNLVDATNISTYQAHINFPYGGNTINVIAGSNYLTVDATNGLTYNGAAVGGATTWANIANINNASGPGNIAIGTNAGISQGQDSIAIGDNAGNATQGQYSVAIGSYAGQTSQKDFSVAIGYSTAYDQQGNNAIAIGNYAGGETQGDNAIAIGYYAGYTNQPANSIVLNGSGAFMAQNPTNSGFYVNPVRNDTGNTANAIYYNTTTNELTYGPVVGGNTGNFVFNNNYLNLNNGADIVIAPGNTVAGNARIIVPGTDDISFTALALQNFGNSGISFVNGDIGTGWGFTWGIAADGTLSFSNNTVEQGNIVTNGVVTATQIGNSTTYLHGDGSNISNITVSALNNTANSQVTLDAYADLTFYYDNAQVGQFGWDGGNDLYVSSSNGNILVESSGGVSGSKTWTFDNTGNITTPNGGLIGPAGTKGDGTMITGGRGNITSLTSYYSNVSALNYSSCVTVNADGTLNITTYGDGTGQTGQWAFSGTDLTIPGNILGVAGGYNQPNFITPNSADINWSFGISSNLTTDFWMQAQFYGLNQTSRGFRVFEAEGESVVFSVNGAGQANVSGNVSAAGFTTTGSQGNITGAFAISAQYLYGDGSNITGISTTSNAIVNGTSNVTVLANSSIQMYVPTADANIGAVSIIGSSDGNTVPPQNTGVMLHLTGQAGTPSRIYNDSVANYAGFVGRSYNGTVDSPTAILANSIISRYAATPYTSVGWPAKSTARIDMVTTENQTGTNQGTEIQFWTTALGSNTIAKVMSLTNNDINLAGNITAIGNATFSTNPAYVNSITVGGTNYDAQVVIDDVGADHVAQLILNRASTSVQPILATALNNSDDPTANVDVNIGQTLFQLAALGFAGTDYKEFASIIIGVDDNGNVSDGSSPGKITFTVSPDGSTSTNTALTIHNDTNAEFNANISATSGNIIAAYFYGDGSNISNVQTSVSVTGNSQGNITAVGTLSTLTVGGQFTANANAQFNGDAYFTGNVNISGNINQISGNSGSFYGNLTTGFDALYAGLPAGYNLLPQEITQFAASYDGYSQVSIQNINGGGNSTSDLVVTANNGNNDNNFADFGIAGGGYVPGGTNALGNALRANDSYLYAQGNVTAGTGGNLVLGSNQANGVVRIIANGSTTNNIVATFSSTGIVVAGVLSGNGSGLTGLNGANVTGTVANATYATSAGSATTATTAGTVTTGAQPNITSAGSSFSAGNTTLTTLNTTGNATIGGNLTVSGNVNITGNITQISGNSGSFYGNATTGFGALYAGLATGYANIGNTVLQLASNANNYSQLNFQNISNGTRASADFILTADTGNDSAYFGDFGIASSTYNYPGYGIIGTHDVYLLSSGSGNAGVDYSANLVIGAGNGPIKFVSGGFGQANLVATMDPTGLTIVGNIVSSGNITSNANISGSYILGNGSQLTGLAAPYANANVFSYLGSNSNVVITTTGNITTTGTATVGNLTITGSETDNGNLTVVGNITGGNISTSGTFSAGTFSTRSIALPYSNTVAYTANVITFNGNTLYRSNGNVSANIPFALGNVGVANTFSYVKQWVNPNKNIYIDPAVGNDSFDGSINTPFATLGAALDRFGNLGYTYNLLPGTYTETLTIADENLNINGPGYGEGAHVTGTWTVNHVGGATSSVRIYGVYFEHLIYAGTSDLYLDNCGTTLLESSGTGYLDISNSSLENGKANITMGAGGNITYCTITNSTLQELDINGNITLTMLNSTLANANVNLSSGTLVLENSLLTGGGSNTATVLTTASNTAVIVNGSTFADPDGTSSKVSIAGGWSFVSVNYDAANSTITGSNFGDYTYFDRMVTFYDFIALGNITGANISTAGYLTAGAITNTRIVPRIGTATSAATITPVGNSDDQFNITALATSATIAAPSGTPTDGQKLTIRIKDNGSAQTLAWNAIYRVIGVTLPTTTVASKVCYIGCIWNAQDTTWDVVSVAQQV